MPAVLERAKMLWRRRRLRIKRVAFAELQENMMTMRAMRKIIAMLRKKAMVQCFQEWVGWVRLRRFMKLWDKRRYVIMTWREVAGAWRLERIMMKVLKNMQLRVLAMAMASWKQVVVQARTESAAAFMRAREMIFGMLREQLRGCWAAWKEKHRLVRQLRAFVHMLKNREVHKALGKWQEFLRLKKVLRRIATKLRQRTLAMAFETWREDFFFSEPLELEPITDPATTPRPMTPRPPTPQPEPPSPSPRDININVNWKELLGGSAAPPDPGEDAGRYRPSNASAIIDDSDYETNPRRAKSNARLLQSDSDYSSDGEVSGDFRRPRGPRRRRGGVPRPQGPTGDASWRPWHKADATYYDAARVKQRAERGSGYG